MMRLAMNAQQAQDVFGILVAHGNFNDTVIEHFQAKSGDFVSQCGSGISEYWYSTKCGSSIKVFFSGGFGPVRIWVHAQTINTLKEATLVEDTNKALEEYVKEEQARAYAKAS